MSETNAAAPNLSGRLFLFEKPEIVNREAHGEYGLTTPDRPFDFCANVRIVPVNANEIVFAEKTYPIVFTEGDEPLPLAALGVIDDRNLFVDDQGQWEPDCFIPNYIRRYPFALANDQGSDRMALVVDTAFSGFVKGGERKLFDDSETTDLGKQAVDSCRQYETDRQQTLAFGRILKENDLLSQQVAQFAVQEGAQQQPFAQYYAVDENKLKALPDDKFLELRNNGALALIYAHLMSIGNWRRLVERRARRYNLSSENVLKPLSANA